MQDGLGSVRAVVDDAAVVQSSMSFDPYGNPMAAYGAGFGFTGEHTDANGSVFLQARYYVPQLGVFNVLDPFEGKTCTPMTLNGYSWVEGNPIMNTDPTGMTCECDQYISPWNFQAYIDCLANPANHHDTSPSPSPTQQSCALNAHIPRIAAFARQEANQEEGQLFPTAAAIALAEIHYLNKGNIPRSRSTTYPASTRYIDAEKSARILGFASSFVEGSCSGNLVQSVNQQSASIPELVAYMSELEFIAQNPTIAYEHSFKSNNRSGTASSDDPSGVSRFERLSSPTVTNIDLEQEAFKFRVFSGATTSVVVSNDFNPVPLEWNCPFEENRVISSAFNPNQHNVPDFVANSSCVASCNKNLWWWRPPTIDIARDYATNVHASNNSQYNDGDAWIRIPNDNGTDQDYQSVIVRIGGTGHVASCS